MYLHIFSGISDFHILTTSIMKPTFVTATPKLNFREIAKILIIFYFKSTKKMTQGISLTQRVPLTQEISLTQQKPALDKYF